jgi:hypothetical protein
MEGDRGEMQCIGRRRSSVGCLNKCRWTVDIITPLSGVEINRWGGWNLSAGCCFVSCLSLDPFLFSHTYIMEPSKVLLYCSLVFFTYILIRLQALFKKRKKLTKNIRQQLQQHDWRTHCYFPRQAMANLTSHRRRWRKVQRPQGKWIWGERRRTILENNECDCAFEGWNGVNWMGCWMKADKRIVLSFFNPYERSLCIKLWARKALLLQKYWLTWDNRMILQPIWVDLVVWCQRCQVNPIVWYVCGDDGYQDDW